METLPTCLVAKTSALLQRTTVDSVRTFPMTTKLAKAIRVSLMANGVNHDVVLESVKKQLPAWRGSTESNSDSSRSEVDGKETTKLVTDLYFPTHLFESIVKAPTTMKVLDPLTTDVKEVLNLETRHTNEIRSFLWEILPVFRQEATERPEVAVQAWKMICLNPNAEEVADGLKMFGPAVKLHVSSTGKGEAATMGHAADGASRERAPTEGKHLIRFISDALLSPNRAMLLEYLFEAPDLVAILSGATPSTAKGGKVPPHIVALVDSLIGIVGTGTREGAREKAMLSIVEILHSWCGGLGHQKLATQGSLQAIVKGGLASAPVGDIAPVAKKTAKAPKKPTKAAAAKAKEVAPISEGCLVVDAAAGAAFIAEYEARHQFVEETLFKFNRVLTQRPLGMMGFLEPFEVINTITASIALSACGRNGEEFLKAMQSVFQAGLWNIQRGSMSGSLLMGPIEDSPLMSGANLAFLNDLTISSAAAPTKPQKKAKAAKGGAKKGSVVPQAAPTTIGASIQCVAPDLAAKTLGNMFFKDMTARLAGDAEVSKNPAAVSCFFSSAVALGHEEGADSSYKLLCNLLPTLGSFNNEATANSVLMPIIDASSRPMGIAKRYFRARDEGTIIRIEKGRQLGIEAEMKRGIAAGQAVGMKLPVVPYPHDIWTHGVAKRVSAETMETTFQLGELLWSERKAAMLRNAKEYFTSERAAAAMYARIAAMPALAADHECLIQVISMSLPDQLHPEKSGFNHALCNRLILSLGSEAQIAETLISSPTMPKWVTHQMQHNMFNFIESHEMLVSHIGAPELSKVFHKVVDTQRKMPNRPSDSIFKF